MTPSGVYKLIRQRRIQAEHRHGRTVVYQHSVFAYGEARPAVERARAKLRREWAQIQRGKLRAKLNEIMNPSTGLELTKFDAMGNVIREPRKFDEMGNVIRR